MLLLHRFQSPAHIFKHSFKSNCVLLTHVMRNVSHQVVFLFWHDCTSMVKCVCGGEGGYTGIILCFRIPVSVWHFRHIYYIYYDTGSDQVVCLSLRTRLACGLSLNWLCFHALQHLGLGQMYASLISSCWKHKAHTPTGKNVFWIDLGFVSCVCVHACVHAHSKFCCCFVLLLCFYYHYHHQS